MQSEGLADNVNCSVAPYWLAGAVVRYFLTHTKITIICVYDIVYSGSWVPGFQMNMLSASSLKEEPCWEVDKFYRREWSGSQRTGVANQD